MASKEVTAKITAAIEPLTHMQQLYVKGLMSGMSKVAAATAAGQANPKKNYTKLDRSESVQHALTAIREIAADEIGFGVQEAYDMYMQAFHVAATSGEMTKATDSLVKLFGLAKPEVKEIHQHHSGSVEHKGKIAHLSDEQLLELSDLPEGDRPLLEDVEYEEVGVRDHEPGSGEA